MTIRVCRRHAGYNRDLVFADKELAVLQPAGESYFRGMGMHLQVFHFKSCAEARLTAVVNVSRGHAKDPCAVQSQAAGFNFRNVKVGLA